MAITAIQDRLPDPDLATLVQEFKEDFLQIDPLITIYDGQFDVFLNAAMQSADLYCNNPFEAEGVELSIPDAVKLGVFTLAAFMFERTSPGVSSDKSSRIAKTYKSFQSVKESVEDLYLWQHRVYPGL